MDSAALPELEPRFLQPEGWRWHHFTNSKGQKLRFGAVSPKGRIPDAVVVCLPGLSEFAEKYFETARDMLARNLGFWVLDWQGQGRSDRHLRNPHKRHSSSFDNDVDDLHFFLTEYVLPACVHPDVGRIPRVMLAHSMGANIGLHYMTRHPDVFACAAMTAPMIGIGAIKNMSLPTALRLSGLLKEIANLSYVFGGGNWSPRDREIPALNVFSGDPVRNAVHNRWCKTDPALQVGNVTFGWLHEAIKSCAIIQNDIYVENIMTPCLIAVAGQEKLVDNDAIRKVVKRMPNSRLLELPEAKHEILMESDPIRNIFLSAFDALLKENNIKDKLKPF